MIFYRYDYRTKCDPRRKYYRYYDTPDGEDIPRKALVTTRYGLITGVIMATYDVLMYSHPRGGGAVARRYMYHVLPWAAMGATFALVTNSAVVKRKEDDVWNYAIGGVACSPILAYYLAGTAAAIPPAAVVLAAIAMTKKAAIMSGHTFFPEVKGHRKHATEWQSDYSLAKDPKDEWKKNCEKHKSC